MPRCPLIAAIGEAIGPFLAIAGAIEEFSCKIHDGAVTQAPAEMTEMYSPQRAAEALIAAAEASLGEVAALGSWKGWYQ